jgi:hypothetical protein
MAPWRHERRKRRGASHSPFLVPLFAGSLVRRFTIPVFPSPFWAVFDAFGLRFSDPPLPFLSCSLLFCPDSGSPGSWILDFRLLGYRLLGYRLLGYRLLGYRLLGCRRLFGTNQVVGVVFATAYPPVFLLLAPGFFFVIVFHCPRLSTVLHCGNPLFFRAHIL